MLLWKQTTSNVILINVRILKYVKYNLVSYVKYKVKSYVKYKIESYVTL